MGVNYSQLFPIIPNYSQLFPIQSTHEFCRFFSWLLCCDYCDYSPTIISIIFFPNDYFDYCNYSQLFQLFFSAAIISIIPFVTNYFDYSNYSRLFPIISIIPIIPHTNQHIRNHVSTDVIFLLPIPCSHLATQFITYHGTIPWPTCWHTKHQQIRWQLYHNYIQLYHFVTIISNYIQLYQCILIFNYIQLYHFQFFFQLYQLYHFNYIQLYHFHTIIWIISNYINYINYIQLYPILDIIGYNCNNSILLILLDIIVLKWNNWI